MSQYKDLGDFAEQIDECVKCGACRAHCPVFGEQKKESIVARGRLALAEALLDDRVELTERIVGDMSKCLLCGSCVEKCPNKVPTDDVVMAIRREVAKRQGLTSFGKLLATVLKRPALLKTLARGGRTLAPLLFKKIPEQSGLRLRFPMPWVDGDRAIPEITGRPFRDRHPEYVAGDPDKPVVTFFTGCATNYMFPEIGEALLKILTFMGMNVVIPSDQGCCGLPALASGDAATAEKLARANRDALSQRESDFVITACASCHAGLAKHDEALGVEPRVARPELTDMYVFLARHGLPEALAALPRKDVYQRVTYHDPCHLRTRGITAEPRALLAALPGVRFVEMAGADRCCGLGGTFSVYHYETSQKIGSRKVPGLKASRADLVASACPGCMIQLQDIIAHEGLNQKVVHLLDLVARDLPDRT
jgi:glycolate oxidase iron-sulfur subunit